MGEPVYLVHDADLSADTNGPDGRGMYRYRLRRIWDLSKPLAVFVMLNPSTADEKMLDPTLRRCLGTGLDGGNEFNLSAPPCPSCSRGKAIAHWDTLPPRRAPEPSTRPGTVHVDDGQGFRQAELDDASDHEGSTTEAPHGNG